MHYHSSSAELDYMVNNLKRQNIHLKILASAGGATARKVFEEIVTTSDRIRAFAESAATFLSHYNLDGIDIDWEFPKQEHAYQFTALLKVCVMMMFLFIHLW